MAFRAAGSGQTYGGTASPATGGFTTVTGDGMVVFVEWDNRFGALTSISDNKGNTYPAVGSATLAWVWSTNYQYDVFVLPNIAGGAGHIVTANFGAYAVANVHAAAFSGRATSAVVSSASYVTEGTTYTSHAGALVATATADDIIAGASSSSPTDTFTAGSPYFTIPTNGALPESGSGEQPTFIEYRENVSAGSHYGFYTTANASICNEFAVSLAMFAANSLAAAVGNYSIAGQAVSFGFSSTPANLLAATGNYNVAGAPASSDFQIVAAEGIYAYTGESAGLVPIASTGLSAGVGSYSIAGQNATLLFLNFQLGAANSTYSYTGSVASLVPVISPVSLLAWTGSYSIAAQNASLIFSIALPGFRVEAVTAGVYDGVYHVPGDVFDILTATDYSDASVNYDASGLTELYGWMTEVPQSTPLLQQNFSLMFAGTIAPLQRTIY
jgi:hypothetical protein